MVPDHKPNLFPISEKSAGSVITWCPPTMNWNPWNGNNIDEGPLAHVIAVNVKLICVMTPKLIILFLFVSSKAWTILAKPYMIST